MAELDVRDLKEEAITTIRVAERNAYYISADVIEKSGGRPVVCDSTGSDQLVIHDREHAQNLIKGIQKAIDLGWFA